jgi:hypothetical protein
MWCPNCWQKFRWYVRFCPECGVVLVEERPGPPPTPRAELVRVFVALDGALTGVARSLLESEGIEYMVRFQGLQDLFGLGRIGTGYNLIAGPAEFWVRADDADRARQLLQGLGVASSQAAVPPVDADPTADADPD